MEILQQLGELFLSAVPTVLIVFVFYLFLRANFFAPLERAMTERTRRVEGARAEAQAAQAAAKEKLAAYQEAIKKARGQIYTEQEAARQAILDERAKLLRNARHSAEQTIHAAKKRIAGELATARAELEGQSASLAAEIARAILEPRPATPQPVPGGDVR